MEETRQRGRGIWLRCPARETEARGGTEKEKGITKSKGGFGGQQKQKEKKSDFFSKPSMVPFLISFFWGASHHPVNLCEGGECLAHADFMNYVRN